ncbi:MAG: helix-turn-helix domain-containing protein [Actinomycetota bacterium]|nr:helix-turn-helix domain-containing protein [Actinomycetota bacterium]
MTGQGSIGFQRRLLGAELRRLREAAGLLQVDASEVLGKHNNKISRVETGVGGIDKAELEALLGLYDAPQKDRVWCRELAGNTRAKRGKPAASEATLYLGPKWFRAFRDLERGATTIMETSSLIVPGLLQTVGYTRSMFAAQGVDPDDKIVHDTVRVRAERRELLSDKRTRVYWVLSEAALRRQIGGPRVMAEQLSYLAEAVRAANITLQVIPLDAQSYASMNDFRIFRFGHETVHDIVYYEIYSDALYLDKPPELVRVYGELFLRLQGVALGPVESRNFIGELAEQVAAKQTARG